MEMLGAPPAFGIFRKIHCTDTPANPPLFITAGRSIAHALFVSFFPFLLFSFEKLRVCHSNAPHERSVARSQENNKKMIESWLRSEFFSVFLVILTSSWVYISPGLILLNPCLGMDKRIFLLSEEIFGWCDKEPSWNPFLTKQIFCWRSKGIQSIYPGQLKNLFTHIPVRI